MCLSVLLSVILSFVLSATLGLNISETRLDSEMVPMHSLYKLAYGLSIVHAPNDVTPISCHFRDCKALLFEFRKQRYNKYPHLYLFTFTWPDDVIMVTSWFFIKTLLLRQFLSQLDDTWTQCFAVWCVYMVLTDSRSGTYDVNDDVIT